MSNCFFQKMSTTWSNYVLGILKMTLNVLYWKTRYKMWGLVTNLHLKNQYYLFLKWCNRHNLLKKLFSFIIIFKQIKMFKLNCHHLVRPYRFQQRLCGFNTKQNFVSHQLNNQQRLNKVDQHMNSFINPSL